MIDLVRPHHRLRLTRYLPSPLSKQGCMVHPNEVILAVIGDIYPDDGAFPSGEIVAAGAVALRRGVTLGQTRLIPPGAYWSEGRYGPLASIAGPTSEPHVKTVQRKAILPRRFAVAPAPGPIHPADSRRSSSQGGDGPRVQRDLQRG